MEVANFFKICSGHARKLKKLLGVHSQLVMTLRNKHIKILVLVIQINPTNIVSNVMQVDNCHHRSNITVIITHLKTGVNKVNCNKNLSIKIIIVKAHLNRPMTLTIMSRHVRKIHLKQNVLKLLHWPKQPLILSQTKMVVESMWTSLTFRATLPMILAIAKQDTKSITPTERWIAWPMTNKPRELAYLVTGKQKSKANTATFMGPLLVHTINHKTISLSWLFEIENI